MPALFGITLYSCRTPQGSFGEPADRARAWHWLAEVLATAQVENVQVLDRHSPRHPLMRGQSPGRRFETVLLDGYTPPRELREHVARQHGYAATLSAYKHSIWDHLAVRTPHFPERTAWLTRQLTRFQILRVEPTDDTHGIELGLVPDERDQDLSPPPLELQVKRFLSLDGLLLLLLLYREAQDVGHRRQAAQLREAPTASDTNGLSTIAIKARSRTRGASCLKPASWTGPRGSSRLLTRCSVRNSNCCGSTTFWRVTPRPSRAPRLLS